MSSLTQTRVRRYTTEEIPHIVGKIMTEVPKLPHYAGITIDRETVFDLVELGVTSEHKFMIRVLVNADNQIVGGVSGYCVQQLLSKDLMTGDAFLFLEPKYRNLPNVMKLMMAYRDWGISCGATIIMATQTGGADDERLGQLLERYGGYMPVGRIFFHTHNPDVVRDLEALQHRKAS